MSLYVYLAIAGILFASHGFVYMQGWKAAEGRVLKETVYIAEKRNEIANNRPDTNALFDGLWNDKDW